VEANSSFGEWLRARRKALDLTQLQLAEAVGCAEDTIGRIEAGTRRPSKQVVVLLAEALRIPRQSQQEFIAFAREGGSVAGLERYQTGGDIGVAKSLAQLASVRPGRAKPTTWVPYLSTLPQSLTPLIGREAEVAEGMALLVSRQARLLTLTGPPGVGKTRLALALAASLTPAFPDGICFLPLALLRDPDLLAVTVSHALGLSDNGTNILHAERLLDFLRQKRLLLVLDNFEHILTATPQVAAWLSASAHLQVLVTSRSTLHIRGERLFHVSPLPVPPTVTGNSPEEVDLPFPADLGDYPSVALFVERAQAVDPAFRFTRSNWWAVAELCRRMEGLPLAIELTAARSAHLSPELVLARLEQRLDVAQSGPRDLPYHQRTLRAAIAWSYELLDRAERLLFQRMSVFVGGATFDALEAICNALGDIRGSLEGEGRRTEGGLADALEGLLQQSLVYSMSPKGDGQASRRFNMLEMLREYAAQMLAQSDRGGSGREEDASEREETGETEAGKIGRYHAEFFLVIAEEAETKMRTAEQTRWLDILDAERANISTAIEWYARMGDYERALRIAAAIWRFWWVRGPVREGQAYLQRLLADASQVSPRVRGRALAGYADLLTLTSDYEQGMVRAQEAVDALRSTGDESSLADALNALSITKVYVGDVAEGLELAREGLAIRRKLGDNKGLARSLNYLGEALRYQGQYDEANEIYAEALSFFRLDEKDGWGVVLTLHNMAQVATHQGDYDRAAALLEEGFSLRATRENRQFLAVYLALLGRLLVELGGQAEIMKEAARMLAACSSLLESITITIEKADLLNYERALERVQRGLSEEDFRSASREGRSLTLAQAVDIGDDAIRRLRENGRAAG
jgi:predicted ATPase/transcriptional regulator with XRE-family HTH domain